MMPLYCRAPEHGSAQQFVVDRLLPWRAVALAEAAKTMFAIAEGADIRRQSRNSRQRIEDNAFHLVYFAR